nr:sodium/calcium exchanger 2-like [Oncorhynchus nerka]
MELGEPLLLDAGQKHGDSNENKPTDDEVAKMGCPSLGENTRIEVVIEESYEFKCGVNTLMRRAKKNTVDKLIKKTNLALVVGSCSWREQFVSAVTVSAGTYLASSLRDVTPCSRHFTFSLQDSYRTD